MKIIVAYIIAGVLALTMSWPHRSYAVEFEEPLKKHENLQPQYRYYNRPRIPPSSIGQKEKDWASKILKERENPQQYLGHENLQQYLEDQRPQIPRDFVDQEEKDRTRIIPNCLIYKDMPGCLSEKQKEFLNVDGIKKQLERKKLAEKKLYSCVSIINDPTAYESCLHDALKTDY